MVTVSLICKTEGTSVYVEDIVKVPNWIENHLGLSYHLLNKDIETFKDLKDMMDYEVDKLKQHHKISKFHKKIIEYYEKIFLPKANAVTELNKKILII